MKGISVSVFPVGSKVIYPSHGIGIVEKLENRDVAGSTEPCYVIRFQRSGMTIMAPVRSSISVGLRGVIPRREVSKIMKILKDEKGNPIESNWNKRQKLYLEKIKTGSIFEVAGVYRDLYFLRNTKGLSFGEQQVFDSARQLIVSEIAESKGIREDKAEEMLMEALTN